MAEGNKTNAPSFGSLVFGYAVAHTKSFFGSTLKDAALGAASLIIGFGLYWYFQGIPSAMSEVASVIAFGLAPLGFMVFVIFVWNLWLAPAAIAYEAARDAFAATNFKANAPSAARPQAPINWLIWKKRSQYTLRELAQVLAQEDPASGQMGSEASAYLSLLKEEAQAKRLAYLRRYDVNDWDGRRYEKSINASTEVTREAALKWAQTKGLSLAHIE